jgi:flavin reductase (DIM6/NTAB) family NADH-FMN oxidoreductase RutF
MNLKEVQGEKAYRLFYPAVTSVVVAEYNGILGGMPATSCMPTSFNPPTITIAVGTDHLTHRLVLGSRKFTVNFLDAKHSKKIISLAEPIRRARNKVESAGLTIVRTESGVPFLNEALAFIESKVEKVINNHDHDLFLCEIVSAYASEDFQEYWQFEGYSPSVYVGSGCKKYPTSFVRLCALSKIK